MRCPQGRRGSSPLSPTTPFLDNIRRRPVTLSLAWGCSSVGRAQGWQSWGQGFESPQLHHFFSDTYRTILDLICSTGCAGGAAGYVEPIDRLPIRSGHQMAVDVDGDLDRVMAHLLLHVRRGLAVLEEPRRERVAQVVEADAPQPRLRENLVEHAALEV